MDFLRFFKRITACILRETCNPAYHGHKIDRTLVEKMKEQYTDFMHIAVIAYNNELSFYENCGFSKADDASPMFITSLWT